MGNWWEDRQEAADRALDAAVQAKESHARGEDETDYDTGAFEQEWGRMEERSPW